MDATFDNFYTKLNRLINTVSQINLLLKDDQLHLNQNNHQAISISDEKKQQLLNDMNQQTLQLRDYLPVKQNGEAASSLASYLTQLEKSKADKARESIKLLQETLAQGYQLLIINSNVVTANLGYIKEIWDKLSGLANNPNEVYEKPSIKAK